MNTRPLALLVDTYSLFFRAHHALPAMNTKSGEPTSALYGFCSALLKELTERQPIELAFAVDAPQRTFRHERMPSYKGTRDATPAPLVAQFGRLRELLAAFGAPVFEVPGVEADDVLATLAARLSGEPRAVLVMSGDRDLFQTTGGNVGVLFLGARGQKPTVIDESKVLERFLVPPARLPAWVALVGDASDNLPSVPGVGPRTASKWIQRFATVAELLAGAEALEPVRLRDVLLAHREQVLSTESLATLRRDVPLGAGPECSPVSAAAIERLRGLFEELEFKSLVPRLARLNASH
jgi:DNA polymerase-1